MLYGKWFVQEHSVIVYEGTVIILIKEMFEEIKNVVNNVDMSSLREPWQNGPYKN